ncbi:MAG: riboflavin synthase [Alphaproteobacteria bacterium]|nr:riboflavin synthase [Alphaproteobacteria bacterium]
MFTGIVTDIGRVRAIAPGGDSRFEIATAYDGLRIAFGASIACDGACLTVTERGADWFAVTASAETLACTTLGAWRPGRQVNLERALKVGDELGGHIVSGHVDGVAEITALQPEGDSVRFRFRLPAGLERYVAPKGSIALNGVSLTVNDVRERELGVNIIPHTRQHTTFGQAQVGDRVNVEVDLLARYVGRLIGGVAG